MLKISIALLLLLVLCTVKVFSCYLVQNQHVVFGIVRSLDICYFQPCKSVFAVVVNTTLTEGFCFITSNDPGIIVYDVPCYVQCRDAAYKAWELFILENMVLLCFIIVVALLLLAGWLLFPFINDLCENCKDRRLAHRDSLELFVIAHALDNPTLDGEV